MAQWQRFGDGTWVNVDQVEVLQVDEPVRGEDGWQLTATFASGRTHPLGTHANRELLIDCTDAFLGGEVGSHLRALAEPSDDTSVVSSLDPEPAVTRRRWIFWRSDGEATLNAADTRPDALQPQPTA